MLGFWSSLATCAPHHFLPAATSFDYGRGFQTAETCSPPAECGHQGCEYREGCFGHSTCHARFLRRHYSSNINKGMLSLLLRRSVPASRATRTLWPIDARASLRRCMQSPLPVVRGGIEQLTTWVKPGIHSLESSPATLSTTGLWRKFGQKSQRTSPGLPMQ